MNIAIVGYGEVGGIFARGLRGQSGVGHLSAWDLLFAQPGHARRQVAEQDGVRIAADARDLCVQADLVISAVTASNTLSVATDVAPHLRPGTWFLDLNSASPGTKQQAAALVEAAGGSYVEAGVMTSVPPYGIRVPMLLGRPARRGAGRHAVRLGPGCQGRQRRVGRCQRHQDVPQHHDQGPGGAGHRELHDGARLWRGKTRCCPRCRRLSPASTGASRAPTFSAAWCSTASAGPRRCASRPTRCVRPASNRLMTAAIADKQQWVADQARAGVFADVARDAAWQAYADRLLQARKS